MSWTRVGPGFGLKLRRRKPGFTERYYGFGSFTALLDEAEKRGLIEQLRDEKSGGALVRVAQ